MGTDNSNASLDRNGKFTFLALDLDRMSCVVARGRTDEARSTQSMASRWTFHVDKRVVRKSINRTHFLNCVEQQLERSSTDGPPLTESVPSGLNT